MKSKTYWIFFHFINLPNNIELNCLRKEFFEQTTVEPSNNIKQFSNFSPNPSGRFSRAGNKRRNHSTLFSTLPHLNFP